MAEQSSAVLGAVEIAVQDNAVTGGGGMAEHKTAVLGGGGILVQDSSVLGGGGMTDPGSIPLMLRPAGPSGKTYFRNANAVPPRCAPMQVAGGGTTFRSAKMF